MNAFEQLAAQLPAIHDVQIYACAADALAAHAKEDQDHTALQEVNQQTNLAELALGQTVQSGVMSEATKERPASPSYHPLATGACGLGTELLYESGTYQRPSRPSNAPDA